MFITISLSMSNVTFTYNSLTDMSILQGLALKDFLGSIAINPGELA
jgi:hypothetical protein